MTNMMAPAIVEDMPDFSVKTVLQPIPFRIDSEVFHLAGSQPASILFDMAELGKTNTFESQVAMLTRLLQSMLIPESYERFVARMKDSERPITLNQVMDILKWAMEKYSDRPSQPSPSSSTVLNATGTSSTAGVPA